MLNKKNILSTLLISSIIIISSGCSEKKLKINEYEIGECIINNQKAPKWVCGSVNTNNNKIYSVGSASMTDAGFNYTRNLALASARNILALQLKSEIKTKVEKYVNVTGIGDNTTIDKVTTQVSKQIAKVTLKDTKQINLWQGKKELFVLIEMDKNKYEKEIEKEINSSFNNKKAQYQKKEAEKILNKI